MATKRKVRKTQKAKTVNKKHRKIKAKNQSRRFIAKENYEVVAPIPDTPSYEEIVLRNIVNNSEGKNVPDEAILLSSTLSSLSSGMKELHYKSGISIGRSLYKVNTANKSYTFPEESVADLVGFFESVGYKKITYRAYPGSVDIKIHERRGPVVGTSLHSFEAGIIAGYLSSAEGRFVNVNESMCINDNGNYCKFSAGVNAGTKNNSDTITLDRLVDHIAQNAHGTHAQNGHGVPSGYHALASSLLLDKSYIESIKSIAGYMGKSVSEKFYTQHNGRLRFSDITNTIRLLNLGNPIIIDTKPFHLELVFDEANSKREFVDISLAFINGLLSKKLGNDAVAVQKSSNGVYVIDIKERSAKSKHNTY